MQSLSVRMHGFYQLFYSKVSRAADEASAGSNSAAKRRELLIWKSDAVALALAATFRADTLVALLDLWTLCVQLKTELGSGDAERRLGAGIEPMRLAMDELIEEVESIAATVLVNEDLEPVASMVASAAERNPIEGALYTRVSGASEFADLAMSDYALSDVVGLMASRVGDIASLATVVSSDLPRMIRWETEILLADDMDVLTDSAERMVIVAEQIPALVEQERVQLTGFIREERGAILDAIELQRMDTLDWLRVDRIALTDAIRDERVAVMEALDVQRKDTIEVLDHQRVLIIEALGDERQATIDEVSEMLSGAPAAVRQIVDHTFLRVAQLGAALIALFVLAYVGRRTLVRS